MKKSIYLIFSVIILSACSLKYEDTVDVSERVPEFIFKETKMRRFEDNEITVEMNAETLEQYKDTSETYAQNVVFVSYEDGDISTKGSCGLLFTDTDKEIYELYDEIEIFNQKEKMNFFADVLKWNAKNEQLTGGRGDVVQVEKEDTIIRGTGFSASGISKTFSFRGNVTGDIETSDSDEDNSEQESEDFIEE